MQIFGVNPGRRIALYFIFAILIGGILLSLPIAGSGKDISFLDALFTSTSAVCVTGLVVVDTGKDFSLVGQLIILALIQLGGLGIMTFATALFTALGSRLSFSERLGLSQSFLADDRGKHVSLLKAVIFTTLSVELVGAILLFFRFYPQYPVDRAAYYAVFHSISAFCNAGFSLFSNSLESYQHDIPTILIFSALIIAGGLGFAVIREVFEKIKNRQIRFSLHTKLCLTGTIVLLVIGTVAFLVAEYRNTFTEHSLIQGIFNSFFQSVTSRTAGFNMIPQAEMTEFSLLITTILMFIGACPGSTAGGIKITTILLILLLAYNKFRGNTHVVVFKRTINDESVTRAITVFIMSSLMVVVVLSLLMFAEERPISHYVAHGWLGESLFEVISAFGTVGLSLGLTPNLSGLGKVIIIIAMFAGRVGLLTLAFSLIRPTKKGELVYAEEPVMTG